jgi:CRISPR/Cas system-associated exonuclease Cas4 (RecB family)
MGAEIGILNQRPLQDERTLVQLEEVASEIGRRLDERRQGRREPWDHSEWNWASEAGHPCKKFLVHARVDWKERQLMDIDGEYRVEEGSRAEWQMKKDLGDIGFELSETQRTFSIPDIKIKGKVDGLLPLNRTIANYPRIKAVPCEIKTIGPNYWQSTETVDAIKSHRAWWIRGYPSQLNAYLFGADTPFGFFITRTFGKRPRILPMLLDFDRLDGDFRKIEDVNRHVEAGTYPPPIPYDPQICGMCDFAHLCQPLQATPMKESPQGEIPILRNFLDLQEWHERYEEAKKILIGTKEKPGRYYGFNAIIEDIEVSTQVQNRTFYAEPDEVKAAVKALREPYAEKREIFITKIERII